MARKLTRVPALQPLWDREPPAALDRGPPGGGVRACLAGRWHAETRAVLFSGSTSCTWLHERRAPVTAWASPGLSGREASTSLVYNSNPRQVLLAVPGPISR